MKKTLFSIALSIALLGTAATSTMAADGATIYKQKGCVSCHGADGKTPIAPQYPKIAGQNEMYVENQLKQIKDGTRKNGLSFSMKPFLLALTDEDMKALASYLSKLPE